LYLFPSFHLLVIMLFIKFIYTSVTGSFMLVLAACFITAPAYNQVPGCTDPMANNYNPSATQNNGSCTYAVTSYTPPLKVDPISDTLVETSGLQWAGNYLWSFNDGGGAAAIYRIDTLTNALLQRVYLQGAVNIDWEDVSFDGTFFYVGDFGNNANGARTDLKIYKFPLTAIPDHVSQPVVTIAAGDISTIHFSYSDQPQPPVPAGNNNTKFDCEAMIVENGKIHLFTKNWIDFNCTHYVINNVNAGTYEAIPLETLATNYLVTAADKTIDHKVLVLLGYQNSGTANHFLHLLSGYSAGNYFNGNKRRIDLPDVTLMGQAEGISFRNGYYGYISNEKFVRIIGGFTITVTQKLRAFDIRNFVSNLPVTYIFSGNGNWSESSNWSDKLIPPATLGDNSQIIIDPLPGGACILNIPYTLSSGSPLVIQTGKNFIIQGNLIQQ
jgi:hypothetical protein